MKILLTGGSGFLGSALALRLLDAGHDVALLLRPRSSLQRLRGKDHLFSVARVSTDTEIVDFVALTAPDAVIHTACSYGRSGEVLLDLFDANLRLGIVLLQGVQNAAARQRVTFINAGSALEPGVSSYALSKRQFAQWGYSLVMQALVRLQFINVNLQHMYGPGDSRSKFSTHVMHACHTNQPRLELTAGEQERDFIYIADVLSAYEILLAQAHILPSYDEIDVGSGHAPTLRSFVETVHTLTRSKTELKFGALPYRLNEAMHCQADISRMRGLGWAPAFDLHQGLMKTIEEDFEP
jgi:nucleoside-diphosphate-sugar epimerase